MKYVCGVCGYVYDEEAEGVKFDDLADDWGCPVCRAPKAKFAKQDEDMTWAAEHIVGIAQGAPQDIIDGLRGEDWRRAALEEAEHAAKFAELLGEVLTDSTKKNLEVRVAAENGATAGKTALAKRAKELNLDAIHDTVHEMARDEARHGKAFKGLLERYFG